MAADLTVHANGLNFHVLADGPPDGPLVLLLHGFPELSLSWQHQLPALAEAGFRAVAPDQRGYGSTGRRGPYDAGTLAGDVAALIKELGAQRAFVVGHDWGGAIAWTFAQQYPQLLRGLVAANCPPPLVMARALTSSVKQLRKSWYMFFFQIPWLPERLLTKDHSASIAKLLSAGTYTRTAFSRDQVEVYRTAFSEPGAATAAINWYRAALRHPLRTRNAARARIAAPTLILWGVHDQALGRELVLPDRLATVLAPGNVAEVIYFEDAGHFVQNESPERFTTELVSWLQRHLDD